ncbi:dipeptidyl peptidase IV N-terminal region-domain-containing protein [Neohortaea acidophila]|uniref:dipeptidyl-peptidase IV n=1 Tax=Neohortaea acidophila TaxID=245834 RepID=A0A6A6PP27_9PEZI|nr:dipeptidyl peptidase IV N-terminal region-domain-containing protein [Neohortaea acidophila]KAF2481384.1 dipeptidyl peptidase IV N-terminal region-domain-containing protein [Neohortaea acidophila]
MGREGEDELLLREQSQPLTHHVDAAHDAEDEGRPSSVSTTSLVFDHLSDEATLNGKEGVYEMPPYRDGSGKGRDDMELEEQVAWKRDARPADKKTRTVFYVLIAIGLVGWVAALLMFIAQGRHHLNAARPHDPHATTSYGHGKRVTLDQVLDGDWRAKTAEIRWIRGPQGEDGLLLESGGREGRDYLVVEDVRYRGDSIEVQKEHSKTLMKSGLFNVDDSQSIWADETWPNAQHTKVLVRSDWEPNFRHSGTGLYWIFDVATQKAEPLDPRHPNRRVQIASWSPKGDAVVFTRDNNMFIRRLDSQQVTPITNDGGAELFYGVPDWVYEEEVFASDTATWWSGDGKFIAFLRTDESQVPEFPVSFYFHRPSGKQPKPGEENYPEIKWIKYPKAGAPMSVVNLQIYDVDKGETFAVPIDGDFEDHDRLITEVLWAGETGKLLIRSTNRESDSLKMILIDARRRTGRTVRERDVQALDGGWFEISESTTYVPADPANGRDQEGYIDTVILDGYDHLAYFTPLDSPDPKMLTEGKWEVVNAPSKVALDQNLVYFRATKDGSTQRHIYSVDIHDGPKSIKAVTDTNEIAFYDASFSTSGSFALLTNQGPGIPWQKVQSTPTNHIDNIDISIENNTRLHELAKKTLLPIEIYGTINVDGFDLNYVERRPPHFDDSGKTQYPVLFYLYNGPNAQEVQRKFQITFQSYVASTLGYIVVTVDGRGTGFMGRKHRTIIRGNLGYWEAHDQIAAAKIWGEKKYVDAERVAIWGWSYGGFMTLKVLEADAGQTFHYGMAVAPVTDWRYYDSIYTERYMHTPQHNPTGYQNASISNVTALSQNVKFLVMHGASDDNVHFQNTLSLLDKLDKKGVRNYDVHVFPDSDHSIYFHGANAVVYHKLSDWLVNAFNGEWLKTDRPEPIVTGLDGLEGLG